MGIFAGCCVIAAVVWYVGRKIARALFGVGLVLENIGARQFRDWPTEDEIREALKK